MRLGWSCFWIGLIALFMHWRFLINASLFFCVTGRIINVGIIMPQFTGHACIFIILGLLLLSYLLIRGTSWCLICHHLFNIVLFCFNIRTWWYCRINLNLLEYWVRMRDSQTLLLWHNFLCWFLFLFLFNMRCIILRSGSNRSCLEIEFLWCDVFEWSYTHCFIWKHWILRVSLIQ